MARGLSSTTAPAVEPLTRAEVANYLRVDSDITEDNDLLDMLIVAARRYAEDYTGKALITQTWTLYQDAFPTARGWMRLPKGPHQSVTSIKYYDENGNLQTWSSSNYAVDTRTDAAVRITLAESKTWPDTHVQANSVEVLFVAGYGDAGSDVPHGIRVAMLQMIAHWYENRETVTLAGTPRTVPFAAEALLWSHRGLLVTDTGMDT